MITRRTVLHWLATAGGTALAAPAGLAITTPAAAVPPQLGSAAALRMLPAKWFLDIATGEFRPAADAAEWAAWHTLAPVPAHESGDPGHADHREQARAARRLRKRLQAIEIRLPPDPGVRPDATAAAAASVHVSRWRENGGDLRPFFKAIGLAHEGTTVELVNLRRAARARHRAARQRLREAAPAAASTPAAPAVRRTTGSEFLYGEPLNGEIAVDELVARWQRRHEPRAADWSLANTGWWMPRWPQLRRPGIPWAALEAAWPLVTPVTCPNCDQPTILAAFGERRISFLGFHARRESICPTCRRRHVTPLAGLVDEVKAVLGISA